MLFVKIVLNLNVRMSIKKKAKAAPDPLVKKRKDNADNESESKKVKVDNRTQEEKIKSSTVPLWDVPYEEQVSFFKFFVCDLNVLLLHVNTFFLFV